MKDSQKGHIMFYSTLIFFPNFLCGAGCSGNQHHNKLQNQRSAEPRAALDSSKKTKFMKFQQNSQATKHTYKHFKCLSEAVLWTFLLFLPHRLSTTYVWQARHKMCPSKTQEGQSVKIPKINMDNRGTEVIIATPSRNILTSESLDRVLAEKNKSQGVVLPFRNPHHYCSLHNH